MLPIHPGEILKDELEELGLSPSEFAKHLSVPTNRITFILNGKNAITADTALRLAKYFGTTAQFWLNLQMFFDLKTAPSFPRARSSNTPYRFGPFYGNLLRCPALRAQFGLAPSGALNLSHRKNPLNTD